MSDRKSKQLDCNFSTASSRLKKLLLFDLVKKLNLDVCFRCGWKILTVAELSLEHKISWLDSGNAVELFYDLDNIAFSHLKCNSLAKRTAGTVNSVSGFKGVSFNDSGGHKKKYVARLDTVNTDGSRKIYRIGRFFTPEEAAIAYDLKAREVLGDRAITNSDLGLVKDGCVRKQSLSD
jgi:hypothetical protein